MKERWINPQQERRSLYVCISVSRRPLEPFETSHPIGTLNKPLPLSTADIKYEWS